MMSRIASLIENWIDQAELRTFVPLRDQGRSLVNKRICNLKSTDSVPTSLHKLGSPGRRFLPV
jgi:hypothetical protein